MYVLSQFVAIVALCNTIVLCNKLVALCNNIVLCNKLVALCNKEAVALCNTPLRLNYGK